MTSCCNVSVPVETENDQQFGVGYKEALRQLTGLNMTKKFLRLEQEVELLPQFAGMVPKGIPLKGFGDLISKMTPNILLHQTKIMRTFLHKMTDDGNVIALRALLAVGPEDYREMVDKDGRTALHIAATIWSDLNCVKALLKDTHGQNFVK
eukprot:TRINITY_DN3080_c0_g1_i3.p1 TRINITY_DN3080_c0_g1~~TRINITY_DN3080_c0_g1_i3.p1  ORF type:complete len:151 (+),score=31.33 TRINITY_DN3080_c0_g1_i3:186-638(+)